MKLGVLLVAYGSANFRGTATLRAVQLAAEKRFGLPVRWAFTSETMRQRLAVSKTKSDSVFKALARMSFERYTHVAVQSLHIIPGSEFEAVASDCRMAAESNNMRIELGRPLLADIAGNAPSAIEITSRLLVQHIPDARKSDEPVIYMAHGSQSRCAVLYRRLDEAVRKLDPKIFVAPMLQIMPSSAVQVTSDSIKDGLHYLLPELESMACRQIIWLLPLLSLVGKHTLTDMAGTSRYAWKQRIESAGFQCKAELRSLADDQNFIALWFNRLEDALNRLVSSCRT